ncbi:hypothetical protein BaRGS_00037931 [Batillaria attramentaria]|uniref:Uncharacterized protein n=1 Tax=Batillaria attramentaria TaxID=370345 RepID=A0ABD0J8M8_9CAEN
MTQATYEHTGIKKRSWKTCKKLANRVNCHSRNVFATSHSQSGSAAHAPGSATRTNQSWSYIRRCWIFTFVKLWANDVPFRNRSSGGQIKH